VDSILRLRAANVKVIGAGKSPKEAHRAHIFTTASGRRVAMLAIDDTDTQTEQRTATALVASAVDRAVLQRAIAAAREQVDLVLALVHWGEENTARVTEKQRELARWLIDAGVDAIAGSHPHVIQPLDHYRGRPIAYSLGNLVFDGAPSVAGWNKGNLLELDVTSARFPKARTIPIQLDDRGLPQLMPPRTSVAGSP
jgi:poly-gamma-glutamate capsule biosynthesis protein CapA/YwtB (metallophosphatase superfamily)